MLAQQLTGSQVLTNIINTTNLAREYKLTTRDMEARLRRLGISPVQEAVLPSGRKFMVWPEAESRAVLDAYQAELRQRRLGARPRSAPPERPADVDPDRQQLLQEVRELKAMVRLLLDRAEVKKAQ